MNLYLLLLFILAIVLIIGYFSLKIIQEINSKKKYKDVKAEKNADLFRLQMKWTKRGEIEFAQAIGIVIDGLNEPEEDEALTESGKRLQKQLRKEDEEESN